MDIHEYTALAAQVRKAQKAYFFLSDQPAKKKALQASITLEMKLDEASGKVRIDGHTLAPVVIDNGTLLDISEAENPNHKFIALVVLMRRCQRIYFKAEKGSEKKNKAYEQSTHFEKLVDQMLKVYKQYRQFDPPQQTSLF